MTAIMTMTDVAFNALSKRKREVEFTKLWTEVSKTMKIPEEKLTRKKSQFYSELMMDNRFASFPGNKWDLKARRKFEETHINKDNISYDDDEEVVRDEEQGMDLPKGEDAYN